MTKDEIIRDKPEELIRGKTSRNDPIIKRDVMFHGQRTRLRSYRPESMRELCSTCTRAIPGVCDHILQPLPSKDGTQLCIEFNPRVGTMTCPICRSLNYVAVDNVRCWKCKTLLIKPSKYF